MSNPKSSIHKQSFSYGGESVACVDSSVKIKLVLIERNCTIKY